MSGREPASMQQRVVLVRRLRSSAFLLALSHERTARYVSPRAQVNNFVIDTAHLLNRFAAQAERNLERVDECVSPILDVPRSRAR